jgi:hypothetical protein
VTRLIAVVFFNRFDSVGGCRAGCGRVESNNLRADTFALDRQVDDFALHRRTTAVQLYLSYLVVGLANPLDLDVPDIQIIWIVLFALATMDRL